MKLKYVPNTLSVIRLLVVPLFVWLFLSGNIIVAIILFVFGGATDVIDGYIARKFNCSSALGKILDPLADKALQLSAFVCLYIRDYIPLWMVIAYVAKELSTVIGALIIFKKSKFVVKSNYFGKLATVIVFAAVFVIALFKDSIGSVGVTVICVLVALYFVFSISMYFKQDLIKVLKNKNQ